MVRLIEVSPWQPMPGRHPKSTPGRSMYITERMINAHGPTDECPKCSTGTGHHSAACRQRFDAIQYDLLQEKLKEAPVATDSNADATIVSTAADAVGPAPAANTAPAQGMQAGEDSSMGISQDAVGPAPPTANKKARVENPASSSGAAASSSSPDAVMATPGTLRAR